MSLFPAHPDRLTLADGIDLAYHRNPGASPGVVFLGGFTSDMTGIKATRWSAGAVDAVTPWSSSRLFRSRRLQPADGTIGHWARGPSKYSID